MSDSATTYRPSVSVIVPVYNSSATLEELYSRLVETMERLDRKFELIFIFDGGREEAWKLLLALKRQDAERVLAVRLARNYGQHAATLCGLSFAQGQHMITIDDDLQTPPEAIEALLERQEETGADLVYGLYRKQQHGWFRNLGSKVFKRVFRYLVNGIQDGSSFRLISRRLADEIVGFDHHHIFLDQILSWYTQDVAFTAVDHFRRKEGKSGYSTLKLFRMAFSFFITYTDLPLKIMTWVGFFSSVLSLVLGTFFIVQRLLVGAQVGFTALISAIFFTGSVILLCLGILGEYLSRIYQSRLKRPPYTIKVVL